MAPKLKQTGPLLMYKALAKHIIPMETILKETTTIPKSKVQVNTSGKAVITKANSNKTAFRAMLEFTTPKQTRSIKETSETEKDKAKEPTLIKMETSSKANGKTMKEI